MDATTAAIPSSAPAVAARQESCSGHVVSGDGTHIAFDRIGQGPPVILVVGALCSRTLGPGVKLAPALADQFTVFTYDRRGRGDSGDGWAYAVEREIEDLEALIREAGGSASVFGHSSGAVLALEAAAHGLPIERLALYEAPLVVDRSRATTESDWAQVDGAIAQGRRGDAVKAFLRCIGVPALGIAVMRCLPVWTKLTAVAHTLPYDGAIVRELQRGEPLSRSRWSSVRAPALAIHGRKSPLWMEGATRALAGALAKGEYRSLEGQSHDVSAKALSPVLSAFFGKARYDSRVTLDRISSTLDALASTNPPSTPRADPQ
jgi:pimeloyl-ACP methyl ester carboxylesterase